MSFSIPYQVPRAACLALIVALAGNLSGADPQAAPGTNAPATGQRRGPFGGTINQNQRPMPKAEWLDPEKGAPNGTQYKIFRSKVLGHEVSYLVYLPPDYEKQTQRYPVIYWLHGMGGSQRAGAVNFVPHLETAINAGQMPPTIVVLVNGMVKSFYCDSIDGRVPMESVIIKDLIPHVDQTYRTIARREGRVIQGYSP